MARLLKHWEAFELLHTRAGRLDWPKPIAKPRQVQKPQIDSPMSKGRRVWIALCLLLSVLMPRITKVIAPHPIKTRCRAIYDVPDVSEMTLETKKPEVLAPGLFFLWGIPTYD